jgi:hypothetical protein
MKIRPAAITLLAIFGISTSCFAETPERLRSRLLDPVGIDTTEIETRKPDRFFGRFGLGISFEMLLGFHGPDYVEYHLGQNGWDYQDARVSMGWGAGAGFQLHQNILWVQLSFGDTEVDLGPGHAMLKSYLYWEIWLKREIGLFDRQSRFKLVPHIGWGRGSLDVEYKYNDPKFQTEGDETTHPTQPDPYLTQALLSGNDDTFVLGIEFETRIGFEDNVNRACGTFFIGYEYRIVKFNDVDVVSRADMTFPYTFPILWVFEGENPNLSFDSHYITFGVGIWLWAVK